MKRGTVLSSLGLILLLAAAPADANLECLMAGQIAFAPAHPGVADQITYKATLSVAQFTTPPVYLLNRTVVTGNNIEVDFVVSDDLSPFPEYTLADPTPATFAGAPVYGGSVGALALGQYAVTINIGEYRSVDGQAGFQKNTCGGPWHANLGVESYPAPTQKREVVEYRKSIS